MNIFYLIVINIIPVTMILMSFYLKYLSKGRIRKIAGFRTSLSQKNKANWKFGNEYSGKLNFELGIITELSTIILIFLHNFNIDEIGYKYIDIVVTGIVFIQLGVLIFATIKTEQKLTEFDRENN